MTDIYLQNKIVGNANLSCLSTKDALSLLDVWLMKNEKKKSIIFCNSYSVSLAETNKKFSEAINNGDIIFPDGFPVSLMIHLKPTLIALMSNVLINPIKDKCLIFTKFRGLSRIVS